MQVLATYAGEEADEWELDGMAAITRNTYGEGEAYFLGCDLGVSDLTRFVGGWLAAQPQDGRQPEANLRSPAAGLPCSRNPPVSRRSTVSRNPAVSRKSSARPLMFCTPCVNPTTPYSTSI